MIPVGLRHGYSFPRRDHRSRLQRGVHRHLRRLERVWVDQPIYFVTTCTARRRPTLASVETAAVLAEEWQSARERHGWAIGRYVILPDQVHYFGSDELDAKPLRKFMHPWKQWTSKRLVRELKFAVSRLAGGIFRSHIAIERELRPEMGIRARESCTSRFRRQTRAVALSR